MNKFYLLFLASCGSYHEYYKVYAAEDSEAKQDLIQVLDVINYNNSCQSLFLYPDEPPNYPDNYVIPVADRPDQSGKLVNNIVGITFWTSDLMGIDYVETLPSDIRLIVLMHEIGHSLKLGHTFGTIMSANVNDMPTHDLAWGATSLIALLNDNNLNPCVMEQDKAHK